MLADNKKTMRERTPVLMAYPVLIGAAIGLLIITLLLLGSDAPNPEWGRLWMIKPLMMVPIAGAMGGVFYYWMDNFRHKGGLNKPMKIALSLIAYIIAIWLGIVVGLDGTMWD